MKKYKVQIQKINASMSLYVEAENYMAAIRNIIGNDIAHDNEIVKIEFFGHVR